MPEGGPWRRRALLGVLVAAAAGAGVALLIGKAAGYAKLLDSLRGARLEWLALGLAAEALAILGYVLVFRAAARLDGGPALGFSLSGRIVLASLGAMRLVLAGGPGLLFLALRRTGLARSGALARLAALNVLLFAVFAAAGWLAALVLLAGADGEGPPAMALPWLIGVSAAGAAAVALAALQLGGRARHVLALVRRLLGHPFDNRSAFAGAALFWAGDLLCLWASLRAFGAEASAAPLFLAYATAYVVTTLPLPLGGAGGAEAVLTLSLHAVGIPLAPALLGVLAYRLFSFWLPTVPGLALLAAWPLLSQELSRTSRSLPRSGTGPPR